MKAKNAYILSTQVKVQYSLPELKYISLIYIRLFNLIQPKATAKQENRTDAKKVGALTASKDESRGKILCFRVQVHVRPRTNLAMWLGDKYTVKQSH